MKFCYANLNIYLNIVFLCLQSLNSIRLNEGGIEYARDIWTAASATSCCNKLNVKAKESLKIEWDAVFSMDLDIELGSQVGAIF